MEKKLIVAVSGGVDSVVLLDMLAKKGDHELIVAHFDHGIREDSADDARFVEGLAKKYHLPFVSAREELGFAASEELARNRRYAFLREQAKKQNAIIVTAHHGDDVVETIAINIIRGTGWRGAAVLGANDIARPLLHFTKQELRHYALEQRLEWVEDSTNASDAYLRNRIRSHMVRKITDDQKQAILEIWKKQAILTSEIDDESAHFLDINGVYSRYFFTTIDTLTAQELLRVAIMDHTNSSLTRPQIERGLLAIKTIAPGKIIELGEGVRLRFTLRTFIVETP